MPSAELTRLFTSSTDSGPRGRIVRLLSERGSLSAAQIARLTGLAKSTVSQAVAELRKAGVVIEAPVSDRPRDAQMGRPAVGLTLNPSVGTCVGVVISRDNIRVILADVSHAIAADRSTALALDSSVEEAARVTRDLIDAVYEESKLSRDTLLGVGLAVPGPIHPQTGCVLRSSGVPTWAGIDLRRTFEPLIGSPIFADNESNCAAIAEMTWGAAVGYPDFVFFKMDLGIGGAVVIGGQVVTGVAGAAGEFGHISLDGRRDLCRCGNRGCIELYAGFNAVLAQAATRFGPAVSLEQVLALAAEGDVGYRRLISDAAALAGRGLAQIGTALNPPLIVVGGRVAAVGPLLLEPLVAEFERDTLIKRDAVPEEARTRIVAGAFPNDDSCLGALGLVLRHHGRLS